MPKWSETERSEPRPHLARRWLFRRLGCAQCPRRPHDHGTLCPLAADGVLDRAIMSRPPRLPLWAATEASLARSCLAQLRARGCPRTVLPGLHTPSTCSTAWQWDGGPTRHIRRFAPRGTIGASSVAKCRAARRASAASGSAGGRSIGASRRKATLKPTSGTTDRRKVSAQHLGGSRATRTKLTTIGPSWTFWRRHSKRARGCRGRNFWKKSSLSKCQEAMP